MWRCAHRVRSSMKAVAFCLCPSQTMSLLAPSTRGTSLPVNWEGETCGGVVSTGGYDEAGAAVAAGGSG